MLPWIASLSELNPFVAYELDGAVATFGLLIKNALQETVEEADKRIRAKYKLSDLLDDDFQFQPESSLGIFRGIEGYGEVRA